MRFSRDQRFFLITPDESLKKMLLENINDVEWTTFKEGRPAIDYIFSSPPDMLIVDSKIKDINVFDVITLIKSENIYRQVPVIICFEENFDLDVDKVCSTEIDDFLIRPLDVKETIARIYLTYQRSFRALDANPLTKLPGNTSIIRHIQMLLDKKEEFALAYADLDNFKAFNDRYGFSRGDEVILMTARIITNMVRSFKGINSFVGHIGGDDFVFIVPLEYAELACKGIVNNFDSIIPYFYDEEDKKRGYIVSKDRQGNERKFPFVAISIGVVFNRGNFKHYGEISQEAVNLKKKAKEYEGSCYILDRRKYS